jgi:hypothetical protein
MDDELPDFEDEPEQTTVIKEDPEAAELLETKAKLAQQLSEKTVLEGKNRVLRNKNARLEKENKDLRTKNAGLSQEKNKQPAVARENKELKTAKARLLQDKNQLAAANARLAQEKDAAVEEIKNKLLSGKDRLEADLKGFEEANDALALRAAAAESALQRPPTTSAGYQTDSKLTGFRTNPDIGTENTKAPVSKPLSKSWVLSASRAPSTAHDRVIKAGQKEVERQKKKSEKKRREQRNKSGTGGSNGSGGRS